MKLLAIISLFVLAAAAAASATVDTFAIAEQSPGTLTFSVLTSSQQDLVVTLTLLNANSEAVYTETAPLPLTPEGADFAGRVTFTNLPTGLVGNAQLHRLHQPGHPLATVSFTSP